MMIRKTLLIVFIICGSLFITFIDGFSQTVKILYIKGKVYVKKEEKLQKAQLNMLLDTNTQVITREDSLCILAIDKQARNTLTIKENSSVLLEKISPFKAKLDKGRVFSVIKKIPKGEKFIVRTPVVVSGARGTGWSVEFNGGRSILKCFEGQIFVNTPFYEGILTQNNALEFDEKGAIFRKFKITDTDMKEWQEILDEVSFAIERFESSFLKESENFYKRKENYRETVERMRREDRERIERDRRTREGEHYYYNP